MSELALILVPVLYRDQFLCQELLVHLSEKGHAVCFLEDYDFLIGQ